MAFGVRYKCNACGSVVQIVDNDGKVIVEESVPCPKLGCNDRAVKIWSVG